MKHMVVLAALIGGFATPALALDARVAKDFLSVLSSNGASGQLKTNDDGEPWIDAKAGSLVFSVDYYRCNSAKTSCGAAIYSTSWSFKKATLSQVNRWNRWAVFCSAYLDTDDELRGWMPVLLTGNETRNDLVAQQDDWMKCLADMNDFANEPEKFLKQVESDD